MRFSIAAHRPTRAGNLKNLDSVLLPHEPGLDQAGTYTLRFDYRYDGEWDKKVAREGVKDIWRGWIYSREVTIVKE